jgi:hypothetical protein
MVEMRAETEVGLYVTCQLLSYSNVVKVKVEVSLYTA